MDSTISSPAALIVVPVSTRSTTASARPNPQAASTLPLCKGHTIRTQRACRDLGAPDELDLRLSSALLLVCQHKIASQESVLTSSYLLKYFSAMAGNEVTTRLPASTDACAHCISAAPTTASLTSFKPSAAGACTASLHCPKPSFATMSRSLF
eukprot:427263-Hanusia_phi.AAC.1